MSYQRRDKRDNRDQRDSFLDSHAGLTWRREARRVTNEELSHRCPPPPTHSTFFSILFHLSLLLFTFSAFSAFAAPTWTTGTWTTFTAASGNLLKGLTPSSYSGLSTSEGQKNVAVFTDGEAPLTNSKSTTLGNNATLVYSFTYPSRLDAVRFYTSQWSGRNNITITSIAYRDKDGRTATIAGSSVNYATAGSSAGYAYLADSDSAPLAESVVELTVNFGAQENNYVGFAEIEAIGAAENYRVIAVDPVSAAVPTPAAGLATFTPGAEVTYSTPAGPLEDESGFKIATCTGYEIAYADGTSASDTASTLTFTPTQPFTLTWKYSVAQNPAKDVPERALIAAYVQDNLFAFWDAIYNQGTNAAHSSTAVTWTDIAGDHDLSAFTNPGNVLIDTPTWNEKSASFTGTTSGSGQAFACSGGDGNLLASNRGLTLELVGDMSSYSGDNRAIFVMSNNGTDYNYSSVPMSARLAQSSVYCTFGSGQNPLFTSSNRTAGDGSMTFTFVTDGANAKLYYRGELFKTWANGVSTAKAVKNLVIGTPLYGSFVNGAAFTLNGARLYDRALTADEIRSNYAIDCARYYGGDLGDTMIHVIGESTEYGTPDPAYGSALKTAGKTVTFSASGTLLTFDDQVRATSIADDERAVYLGYAVSTSGVTVASGDAETLNWTVLKTSPGATELKWLWRHEYLVSAEQSGFDGSKIEITGVTSGGAAAGATSAWCTDGATVTIKAIPAEGALFSGWAGDTDGIADLTAAETTLTVGKANQITALFVDSHHDPVTVTVKSGASGSWFTPSNWEGGAAPQEGDTVLLIAEDGTSPTLELTASTPHLAKVVVSNGTANCTTTLSCANWETCLIADEVIVGGGGVIKPTSGFYDTAMSNRVWIAASSLRVDEGGKINAVNAGWAPGNGSCRTLANGSTTGSAGAAHGGECGDVWSGYVGASATTAKTYGSAEYPYEPGCGYMSSTPTTSSLASSGGGAIFLDVTGGAVVIDGTVSADTTSLGASGGSVLILCSTIDGAGSVSASAARGFDYYISAGGGGGRVAIHYDPTAQAAKDATCRLAIRARGGYSTELQYHYLMRAGGPGTVWLSDARFIGASAYAGTLPFSGEIYFGSEVTTIDLSEQDLTMTDDNLFFKGLDSFRCKSFTASGAIARAWGPVFDGTAVSISGDVTLTGAALWVKGGSLTVGGDVTLTAGASAYYGGELWTDAGKTNAVNQFGVTCDIAGRLTVNNNAQVYPRCHKTNNAIPRFRVGEFYLLSGGKVNGNSGGSSGKAVPSTLIGGAGTSHGGRGAADADRAKYCYGDEKHPVCPGSGCNSDGGSVFYLTAGAALLGGTIDCSAASEGAAPGSGGSVYLEVQKILDGSSGSILAKGGSSTYPAGGGRIAIYCHGLIPAALIANCSVAAGTTSNTYTYPAEDGTIFLHRYRGAMIILR